MLAKALEEEESGMVTHICDSSSLRCGSRRIRISRPFLAISKVAAGLIRFYLQKKVQLETQSIAIALPFSFS